ncbi:MAG: RNA polymerase sigma-70 factor [Bacteroidota bacterium]
MPNTPEINQAVFKQIDQQYHRKIWAFALRHVKISDVAEDLVHDTFLKIWQNRARYRVEENFEALLYTILRNELADYYRKTIQEEEKLLIADFFQQDAPENEHLQEQITQLKAAIEALPPRRREIFKLSREEGLTYKEIAEKLSISKNTVEVHIVKARQFLREQLSFFLFFI